MVNRFIILFILLFLSGCAVKINNIAIDICTKKCSNNGGLSDLVGFTTSNSEILCECTNGAAFLDNFNKK